MFAPAQKMRYNGQTMLATNQIVQGDSIQLLNDGPPGWVDLCFADPPFNIGYLYHNYDDQKDVGEQRDGVDSLRTTRCAPIRRRTPQGR